MRRVVRLYSSTVGMKWVMAITGLIFVGFVLNHMVGNLKAFLGPEAFNAYAIGLREIGHPLIPTGAVLWIARIVLLGAFVAHVHAAVTLSRRSRAARSGRYKRRAALNFSYASQTMRWGGIILLLFIVYHLLHMTIGIQGVPGVDPSFTHIHLGESGELEAQAFRNLVTGLSNPLVTFAYLIAMSALCFHLYHGLWSAMQSLGANHPKYNGLRRPLALGLALAVFVGFSAVPIAILVGAIHL